MGVELTIVFLITLGMSGLTSLVGLIETSIKAHKAQVALNHFAVSVTAPKSTVGLIDLTKQLLEVVQGLAWGAIGLYLLWRAGINVKKRLGLDLSRPGWDIGTGLILAAVIGIPGLGLYLVANHLGFNLAVQANSLTDAWWRLPVTVLLAFQNGFLEEVLVVGYLITRLQQMRWPTWAILATSAVLRGFVPPIPGVRRIPGQRDHGPGLRLVLPPLPSAVAAGDRPLAHRHGGVRRLPAAQGARELAAVVRGTEQ